MTGTERLSYARPRVLCANPLRLLFSPCFNRMEFQFFSIGQAAVLSLFYQRDSAPAHRC